MKTPQSGADRAHHNNSTGPRSAEGKARSSMNALKTGIYSKSLTIPGEDPADLDALLQEYLQRFCPAVPEQRDLVDILVRSTWTLRRLAVAEAQVFAHEMDRANKLDKDSPIGHAFCLSDRTLTRLQRMVNSTQRNFRDALRDLERLRTLEVDLNPDLQPQEGAPPSPLKAPQPISQPAETVPVTPPSQFVSSSSAPLPPAAQKAAAKASKKPLPYHRPGVKCYFEPVDPTNYERCPLCFPQEDSSNDQA
ncbi:MAG TPA: hypothetical protein VGZ73_03925 [Bryobacteraceae bacterium]|jgi:hypothetical protein|nr:hypothetical protein [Bryobacteraceae bacterium]